MNKLLKASLLLVLPLLLNSCIKDEVAEELKKYGDRDTAAIEKLNADQSLGLTKDASGIFYKKTITNPEGRTPDFSYTVGIIYKLTTLDDQLVLEATAEDSAIVNYYTSRAFTGFFNAMDLLKEGEKGIFYIPSNLAYQNQPITGLNEWQPVKLELEIPRIYNETEQMDEYYKKIQTAPDTITASGLRANFLTLNPDSLSTKGKKFITVNYKGSFLNGTEFDAGTFDVELGVNGVVKGFEEAVLMLRKGEKGVFVFPSELGYGVTGQGNSIPPYTPLRFEVEVVSIL